MKHGNSDGMIRIPCGIECKYCRQGREEESEVGVVSKARKIRVTRSCNRRGRMSRKRVQDTPVVPLENNWKESIREKRCHHPSNKKMGNQTNLASSLRGGSRSEILLGQMGPIKKEARSLVVSMARSKCGILEKVLMPFEGREDVLQEHHNNRIAGHFGVAKTYQRLRRSPYMWPKMREEVQECCRLCDVCARTKPPLTKFKAPMGGVGAGITMERIAIDVLGPLPEVESQNKYIIVMGDYFTKWIEAYAVSDHTAETVAPCN
jgi:hypothetical protein